jgi:phosphatidylglycerophosphate synthase
MLDSAMRRLIDPPLNAAGRALARRGVTPDAVTLAGLGFGLVMAAMIAGGAGALALLPLALSRLADGLDGAVARATAKTDFGGYLDITCDFIFYGAIPLAFALREPDANALPAAFLLATFYINGASFLGFALLAERRGLTTQAQGEKSLYYSAGLLEGTETIIFFALLCLLPQHFAPLAWAFGALCLVTTAARILLAARVFRTRSGS